MYLVNGTNQFAFPLPVCTECTEGGGCVCLYVQYCVSLLFLDIMYFNSRGLWIIAKFTDEQCATINQSTAGRFDPRIFVNCLQVSTCKQLTKTLGSKCLAVD